ncbi:protein transport protein sec31 [Elsinoe australis]|uniref:Protein transport protein SEC31 n=1 Tax=Elsinoe australis TaxID=40998 RepID=A0A4U7AV18_9PEZI|nr:protein transport protein sec31 [Elsinoe australis]
MVRLREIQRTAAFAWSPGSASPALATGTKAGAVDADFSNDTTLELWDLGLDSTKPVTELQPAGSINTDSRFHDITWSQPTSDRKGGVIAGALESGALSLWDAEKLRKSPADSHMSTTVKHSGAAKALQFNHFRNELLATAGAKGELYIWDLNNIANPFRLGAGAARADDFDCIDWNKGEKVPHILATGSSGGFVTVWDVRQKKENLTLNNMGRKAVSAVSWDPNAATRLITAVPNDQDPVILVWDLRNSNAPERVLKGHELGVLSLDWCQQDSNLLLSCGKDNRTICWNPHTGQAYGEYPVVTNWTFQTKWNPHNPSLFATASFDGKIAVQSVQNTNAAAVDAQTSATQAADAEDFFSQTQTRPQGPSFSLPIAPKWQKRPCGASFGFGGKLLRFKTDAATNKSTITLDTFAADSSIPDLAKGFEEALSKGDISSFCEKKISESTNEEEKADWQVIKTLHAGKSRKELSAYLGLAKETSETPAVNGETTKAETNGTKDDSDFFGGEGGDSDNFLANLAATKGAKTNQPFSLHTKSESSADKDITSALILGDFDKALDICLADKRLSDSFMIAICGGQRCIDKVQRAYLKEKAEGPTYLRLLASIVGKNLWDMVHNADLADWKEVMATLCTYADESEFSDLCEALGDRLEESISEGSEKTTYRRDASFCYLAGSKLEKVVKIWTQELHERESEGLKTGDGDSGFSVHARSLQDFIEKVSVFRQVTNFRDPDIAATEEWKLSPLYAKYTEYADILASHGQLDVAQKYLDLLPAKYPLAEVAQQRVRRATAKPGAQPAAKQAATAARTGQRPPAPGYPTGLTPAPLAPGVVPSPYAPAAGATPVQPTGPYAPAGGYAPQNSAYQPPQTGYQAPGQVGYQPPGQTGYQPPGQAGPYGGSAPYGGGYQPPQAGGAPPPRSAAAPGGPPPPPKAKAAGDWNDTPDNFFKPPQVSSRRNTPGPAAVSSPFPNSPNFTSPPPPGPGGPAGFSQPKPAPLPPPLKAGQSTPTVTSPPPSSFPVRPPSAAANAYAPPAPSSNAYAPSPSMPGSTLPAAGPPPVMRGASPYNAPPAGAPPSNRYAPAPGAAPSAPAPGGPQPPRNVAPPPNPYARAPSANYAARPPSAAQPVAPPPSAGPPPAAAGPPPSAPPQGPPRGGPPRQSTPSAAPPPAARPTPPPASKHPPGDRSHIPASAQPIYEILAADMARIKAKAPATYAAQVNDTEKRLNILFDHLNNEDLLREETVGEMVEISQAVGGRDYARAQEVLTAMMKGKLESEGGNWMVGVKRLIAMSRATPV